MKVKSAQKNNLQSVAVVIPAFKVRDHILEVIQSISKQVQHIIVVDDACPQKSGELVRKKFPNSRVHVIFHERNMGVGGAVKSGYERAIELGADIVVKIDGDGQMDVLKIDELIKPIRNGVADYSKGNRFLELQQIRQMPAIRILGNLVLSFMTKMSSGYWDIFDPTNGYTAISVTALRRLPLDKISNGFFFESDMLFRLNSIKAVVVDIPINAQYGNEQSNLKILNEIPKFIKGNSKNFFKRLIYSYYLREINIASFELCVGLLFLGFGVSRGVIAWITASGSRIPTPNGTISLSVLFVIVGIQLILGFINTDTNSMPKRPLH
jgi:glycosyltransferase involved in cell wall biosynthesis